MKKEREADMPKKAPPWIKTRTGREREGETLVGVQMLRNRQSSAISPSSSLPCGQAGGFFPAKSTPPGKVRLYGIGALNLKSPKGGSAKGIPKYCVTSGLYGQGTPCTSPYGRRTREGEVEERTRMGKDRWHKRRRGRRRKRCHVAGEGRRVMASRGRMV